MRQIAGKWPVLACLPDVTPQPARQQPAAEQTTVKAAVGYRFDPPQRHSLHSTRRLADIRRVDRRRSSILPRSDPFSIPASRLQETLAPAIRFLMLVALFTVAGTLLLVTGVGSRQRQTPERSSPAARSPSLEPTVTTVEPTQAPPTAAGPIGTNETAPVELRPTISQPPSLAWPGGNNSANSADFSGGPTTGGTGPATPTGPMYNPLQTSHPSPIPSAQFADPPPAIARFPGYILEPPSRQASHDDNQSSVY
jgi:hypothetical protein